MKKLTPLWALLLAGCTTVYRHPTKNTADFERDKYDCQQTAVAASANLGAAGNPLIIGSEIRKCMEIRYGWVRAAQ